MKAWINGQEVPEALEISTRTTRENGVLRTQCALCYERLTASHLAVLLSLALSGQTVSLRTISPVTGQLASQTATLTDYEAQAVSELGGQVIYSPVKLHFSWGNA